MSVNKKIDINISKLTDPNISKLVNKTLNVTGLNASDLKNQSNAKFFADTFTGVVCEVLVASNQFGDFKYNQLIQRNNEMNGLQLLYRGKDLPEVKVVDTCAIPDNCSAKPTFSKKYEDKFDIKLLKVSDSINEYCLQTTFCSNDGVKQFIQQISNDLRTAINIYVEEIVEADFSDKTRYTNEMVIEISKDATEKEITKKIRTAFHWLQNRNRLNEEKGLTKSVPTNIWGLLNISAIVDYESVLNCCANSESRLGSFFDRLQVSDFIDSKGVKQTDIIGVIYDTTTYPIQFGKSSVYSIPCPSEPIIQSDTLYQQQAGGLSTFKSRVLIKVKPDTPEVKTDKNEVNLTTE